MSMKRAAKQLRAAQKYARLTAKRRLRYNPHVDITASWIRNTTIVKRPNFISDRIWQIIVNSLPRRVYGKIVRRMRSKTFGISTRSY